MTLVRLLLCGCLIASSAAAAAVAGSAPPEAPRRGEEIVRIGFAPPLGTPIHYRVSVPETQSSSQGWIRLYRLVFARNSDGFELTATLIGPKQHPGRTGYHSERLWMLLDKPQLFRVSKAGEVSAGLPRGRNRSLADDARREMYLELEEVLGWEVPAMRVGETRQTLRLGIGDYRDMMDVTLVGADPAEARYRLAYRDDAANARRRAMAIARAMGQGANRKAIDAMAHARADLDGESRLSRETGMIVDQIVRLRIVEARVEGPAAPKTRTVRIERLHLSEVR